MFAPIHDFGLMQVTNKAIGDKQAITATLRAVNTENYEMHNKRL